MDKLQPYIDAYAHASDRTRAVYMVVLSLSVLCFATYINTFDGSWARSRLHVIRLAQAYLAGPGPGSARAPLTDAERDKAAAFVRAEKLKELSDTKPLLEDAEKRVDATNVVQIPLFGLTFDVNDLGLVSGASLILLLLLLRYALTREWQNLEIARRKARDLGLMPDAYDLLSTSEVLHRPEPLDPQSGKSLYRPYIDAPLVLVFVPVIAYIFQAAYDFRTRDMGLLLSPAYASFILVSEWIAAAVMIWIAVMAFRVVQRTRVVWHEMQREALGLSGPEHNNESKRASGMPPAAADAPDGAGASALDGAV